MITYYNIAVGKHYMLYINLVKGELNEYRTNNQNFQHLKPFVPFCRLKRPCYRQNIQQLQCGPIPNVMAALPNIGGALWSTPQSLADAHYQSAVQ